MRIKSIFSVFIILSCVFVFSACKSSPQKQALGFWKTTSDPKIILEIGDNYISKMRGPRVAFGTNSPGDDDFSAPAKVKFELVGNELQGSVNQFGQDIPVIRLLNLTDTSADIAIPDSMTLGEPKAVKFVKIDKDEAQKYIAQIKADNAVAREDEKNVLKNTPSLLTPGIHGVDKK